MPNPSQELLEAHMVLDLIPADQVGIARGLLEGLRTKPGTMQDQHPAEVPEIIPGAVWRHALETFGTAASATEWFTSGCGAMNNRQPIHRIADEDGPMEVDRILGCIDHGMIA